MLILLLLLFVLPVCAFSPVFAAEAEHKTPLLLPKASSDFAGPPLQRSLSDQVFLDADGNIVSVHMGEIRHFSIGDEEDIHLFEDDDHPEVIKKREKEPYLFKKWKDRAGKHVYAALKLAVNEKRVFVEDISYDKETGVLFLKVSTSGTVQKYKRPEALKKKKGAMITDSDLNSFLLQPGGSKGTKYQELRKILSRTKKTSKLPYAVFPMALTPEEIIQQGLAAFRKAYNQRHNPSSESIFDEDQRYFSANVSYFSNLLGRNTTLRIGGFYKAHLLNSGQKDYQIQTMFPGAEEYFDYLSKSPLPQAKYESVDSLEAYELIFQTPVKKTVLVNLPADFKKLPRTPHELIQQRVLLHLSSADAVIGSVIPPSHEFLLPQSSDHGALEEFYLYFKNDFDKKSIPFEPRIFLEKLFTPGLENFLKIYRNQNSKSARILSVLMGLANRLELPQFQTHEDKILYFKETPLPAQSELLFDQETTYENETIALINGGAGIPVNKLSTRKCVGEDCDRTIDEIVFNTLFPERKGNYRETGGLLTVIQSHGNIVTNNNGTEPYYLPLDSTKATHNAQIVLQYRGENKIKYLPLFFIRQGSYSMCLRDMHSLEYIPPTVNNLVFD